MIHRFGSYEVDTARVEVRDDGEPQRVEPQVFDLLVHLITHRDRVVTKTELLDEIWGGAFVGESALTSRVKSLRQLVGDSGKSQHVVRTVHGRGYQFVADVIEDDVQPSVTDRAASGSFDTRPATAPLPSGTITFLFSDIEGSSALWERHGDLMASVIERHDEILRHGITASGGVVFATAGDGFAAAFQLASDAVGAAQTIRSALDAAPWPSPVDLRVRLGLHSGEALLREGDYLGATVNRAARIMAAAHGGQTLLSDVTRGLLPASDELRDRGVCQIDPSMPVMRLWQLGDTSFPPLPGAVSSYVPSLRTALIGREDDLDRVADTVADQRMVSIVGPGGAGKTTLALAAADAAMPSFPAGVVFVELAGANDAEGTLRTIARAARIEGPVAADRRSLAEHFARRPMLLVLDNCEHLLDECADFADLVLDLGAECRILTTTREPLGVDGESTVELGSLEQSAAPLFVTRAHAVAPQLDLVADDHRIVELCARLDGLPLAIELAAAQMPHLDLDQLIDRLGHALDMSRGRRSRARDRHVTLESTIAWSYDLLDEQSRSLFRRLGVFPGGFDLDAVEAVADREAAMVMAPLADLVAKNLLVREATTGRFRYLETIRAFAARRLAEADEAEQAAERLRRHMASRSMAQPRIERWLSGGSASAFRTNLDNAHFAFDRSIAGGHTTDALEILLSGSYLFRNTMNAGDGRRWTSLLASAASTLKPLDRLWFTVAEADLAQGTADHRAGRVAAATAVELANDCEDDVVLVVALLFDALHDIVPDPVSATAKLDAAADVANRCGDARLTQLLQAFGAMTALSEGDLDRGSEAAEAVGHDVSGDGYEVFIANWVAWTASLMRGDAERVRYWLERQRVHLASIEATEPWLFLWSEGILEVLEGRNGTDTLIQAHLRADAEGHDISADLVLALAVMERIRGNPTQAAELLGSTRGGTLNNLSHYVVARQLGAQLAAELGADAADDAMRRGAGEDPSRMLAARGLAPETGSSV